MNYKLVLQNEVSGIQQRIWTFKAPVILGRQPGSALCIDHHSVSRQHCQFSLNGDEALVVKDLGSTNGVYVDDNRVQQQILMPNQIIQIGTLRLQIQFSAEDEQASAASHQSAGSVDQTQRVPVYQLDPPDSDQPWWRRLFE